MFTDPYGNVQTWRKWKSLSAGTLIIRLAKGKIKGLEAKRGNSPTLTQERLRWCQEEVHKGEFSSVFIWILAYLAVCVSSWIRAACWKDSVGMLTHGSCCVALSPWDMFLMLILGRVWELLSFRAGCCWADTAFMGDRSSVRQQLLFVQKISKRSPINMWR